MHDVSKKWLVEIQLTLNFYGANKHQVTDLQFRLLAQDCSEIRKKGKIWKKNGKKTHPKLRGVQAML